MTSNKAIVRFIRERTGMSRLDIRAVLQGLIDFTAQELKGGHSVNLHCFGTFRSRLRPGRKGCGFIPDKPQADRLCVKFKPSPVLTRHLNPSKS